MADGADLVEVHVVFDRRSFGPDTSSSLNIDELAQIVEARDAIATMRTSPVDKDAMAKQLAPMRALFT
jgi:N-acetylneuraminate synthase